MEKSLKKEKRNYISVGTIAVLLSACIYGGGLLFGFKEEDFFAIFLLNYAISVFYFFALWFSGYLRLRNSLHALMLSLVLLLISAYSLNQMIPVFESSTTWLGCTLVIVAAACCAIPYWPTLPGLIRHLCSFVLGVGLILFAYLSIYLLPLYPISLIGGILLGFSLHSFIPLLFVIFLIKWLVTRSRYFPKTRWSFAGGSAAAILTVVLFSVQWANINKVVSSEYQKSLLNEDQPLPSWINVAMKLPDNWVTERYLKADLVYSTPEASGAWQAWSMPGRNFDEVRKHDPLVMIASFFQPSKAINEEERVKILEFAFDARHKTQDRLWRGDDLKTTHVISNIRIWPQFRMAYTEQILTVANNDQQARWRNEQEAIYTFHLPEGGVVTSLSLWINGKEEKGILTTKGKADSAYKQIVGVENRDPSVVHWQEGNTVSVRVFPVFAKDKRIFKIGATTPLTYSRGKLSYDRIGFEGPPAEDAHEIVQIDWEQPAVKANMKGFTKNGNNRFIKEGVYEPEVSIDFDAPPLSRGTFHFNGQTYQVNDNIIERQPTRFQKVYLDLNSSWTFSEFQKVIAAAEGSQLFVYDDEMVLVNAQNAKTLFRRLKSNRFSLFPLYRITQPEISLLVTKSTNKAPNLKDLKGSSFAADLERWLKNAPPLCLYNLGSTLNPYLKALKEHRTFAYEQGDVKTLQGLMTTHQFAVVAEDESHVVIDNAGIVLSKTVGTGESNAPDHLLRLFTYNSLMQKLGKAVFANQETDTLLVSMAQEANVVTPLSSLVVLETVADYERFDIKASKNSLQNASMKSKGAVPEPHEWVLIIVTALFLLWTRFQKNIRSLIGRS